MKHNWLLDLLRTLTYARGLFIAFGMICALMGCSKEAHVKQLPSDDFEILMGRDLPSWKYVQTKADKENLNFYRDIFESYKNLSPSFSPPVRIPKIIHFIWVGPRHFPLESVENVRTWIAKHPDWTINFWTDRVRPIPSPEMRLRLISELELAKLQQCLEKSDNEGEKSDLLRSEILYREGGIYVDHDVKCLRSFDLLHSTYDFYCGMDMPFTSSLPSCIHPTNNLIGAKPYHPIFLEYMEQIDQKWDQLQRDYPGTDRDAVLNRVLHRTFWLFGESVKKMHNQGENRDIVFPAYYFDAPKEELALYSRHQYAGTWHEKENPFEKMVRKRLMTLTKKNNQLLLLFGVVSSFQLIAVIALMIQAKRSK